jgi:hypothetical protein
VQVGTGFEQMCGEAVAEHVGIHLLLNTGMAGGVPASVAWSLGIDGPLAAVPAIAGKGLSILLCKRPKFFLG